MGIKTTKSKVTKESINPFGTCRLGTYQYLEGNNGSRILSNICKKLLSNHKEVVMDLETNGKKIPLLKIFLISFTFDGNIAYVFNPDKVDIKPFLEVLQKNPISNHAIKYDYRCIKYIYGININVDWDTYITNALSTAGIGLMVSGANPNALDTVCKRYLKIDLDKSTRDDFMQEIWETNKHISYSADDVLAVYKLIPITKRLLEASEQQKIWEDIEKPLIKVLVDMEISGMPIDIEYALNLRDKYQEKIDELILKIEEIAPGIDHQSNKQIVDFFLQNNVKVPMKDRPNGTRTPTVEAAALEQIDHPLAKLLIEIGDYQHQLSSFLIPWTTPVDVSKKGAYNPVSKGIHGDITQVDTDTGRCSGRNPNLQQCPGDPEFRAVFIAPEGQDLVTCDLSQFELRVIAELSEDEELTRLFIEREKVVSELERQLEYIDELYYTPEIGKKHPDIASLKKKLESLDMHSQTAITLFKLNPEDINFESDDWKKTRGLAKCLSFGIPLILAA